MTWARKTFVGLLTILLFAGLLGLGFSTSSNLAFTSPAKIESWLNQSNLYGHFVTNAIDQADKLAGGDQSSSVSLNDVVVQQAAQSTFSPQLLQKDVNTFLVSNYAWLNGKTSTPDFSIDLTAAKQSFAQKVGQYVKTYLTGLPVCTTAQLAQLQTEQNIDPLTLSCRPAPLDPQTEAARVTQQLATSGDFLSNPVITAKTINPKGTAQATPYYQKYSMLPKAYRLVTKAPWISLGVVIGSAVGILFLAARKRKGTKIIGVTLAFSGLILILTKFGSDQAFNKAEHHIFNENNVGQLQKALTVFLQHVKDQLVKVDMWFGIAYLVLALILLAIILFTRNKSSTKPDFGPGLEASGSKDRQAKSPLPSRPDLPPLQQPPRPKRPRLIQ